MDTPQCGFDGNSDIYGLGVRVGVYLQWLTSIFAENLYEPAVRSTRETNTTYQIAMLVGFIQITTSHWDKIKAIEGFITLLFCFSGACVSLTQAHLGYGAKSGHGAGDTAGSSSRAAGDLLVSMAICAYGIWFLFFGLDKLPRTACAESVFFFARVGLFGWFRTFLKTVFIAGLTGSAFMMLFCVDSLWRDLRELMSRWGHTGSPSPSAEIIRTVNARAPRFLGSIAALAVFIMAVELTLDWNQVRGIDTCATFGQLFPLAVGAGNLGRVGFRLLRSSFEGETRIVWGSADHS